MIDDAGIKAPAGERRSKSASYITKFLFLIIILQWFLLSNVLIRQERNDRKEIIHSHSLLSSTGFSPSLDETEIDQKKDLQLSTESISTNITQNYEGVAVILMLNSPKWYQRRYTSTISNALMNTPPTWAVQIFHTGKGLSKVGLDNNPGIQRLQKLYPDRLKLTTLPSELMNKFGMRKRLLYLTDPWIWENMLADRVLVINGGGVICGNSKISLLDSTALDVFGELDYVGTPWPKFQKRGGEGSISLRNRKSMLDVMDYIKHDGRMTEDFYFVSNLLEMNKMKFAGKEHYRIASKEQTILFGGISNDSFDESKGPPMVIMGTLPNLDNSIRNTVLEICPEIKLIFPVLHNPNCFGAHPNGEECAKSICALQPPEKRKSGC